MNQTADIDALKGRIEQLYLEHRDLDDIIARLTEITPHDQLQVQRLKKRKLLLKDQIAGLADVIKSGNKISAGSNEESRAREVEKAEIASQASQLLLECVEKMRHQQLEEKKSTIAPANNKPAETVNATVKP